MMTRTEVCLHGWYVFYATLYGESPEQITEKIQFGGDSAFPSRELDQMFRKIAWQAVTEHPHSGVKDEDRDGHRDVNEAVASELMPVN